MTTSNRSLVDVIARALVQGSRDCGGNLSVDGSFVLAEKILAALSAAGLPAAALEGVMNQTHVVVPREPTKAMLDAMLDAKHPEYACEVGVAMGLFRAAVAAAPPSPSDAKDADHG